MFKEVYRKHNLLLFHIPYKKLLLLWKYTSNCN